MIADRLRRWVERLHPVKLALLVLALGTAAAWFAVMGNDLRREASAELADVRRFPRGGVVVTPNGATPTARDDTQAKWKMLRAQLTSAAAAGLALHAILAIWAWSVAHTSRTGHYATRAVRDD